jgi:hypothetical protein
VVQKLVEVSDAEQGIFDAIHRNINTINTSFKEYDTLKTTLDEIIKQASMKPSG